MSAPTPPPGGLQAELVADEAELGALADEWRGLAERRGNAFVTPEWFFAALATVDRDATPHVPVVRDADGALRGLIPLVRGGGGPVRFAGGELADRLHPVAGEGDEDDVAGAAGATLSASGRWQRLRFDRVDRQASWPSAVGGAWRPRLRTAAGPEEALPYIPLEGVGWDQYMATRSRNLRSQVGRRKRALERDHGLELRGVSDSQAVDAALAELYRLHDLRSGESGRSSSFEGDVVHEFHRRFAHAAFERGWLRLLMLVADGAPIAAWYGWMIGGRYAYYQAGFDPAWSRSSPGLVLLAETVRIATEEGATEYDLLRGDEDFKLRFAAETRNGRSLSMAVPAHPAALSASAAKLARRAWHRLPERSRRRLRGGPAAQPGGGA